METDQIHVSEFKSIFITEDIWLSLGSYYIGFPILIFHCSGFTHYHLLKLRLIYVGIIGSLDYITET